MDGLPAPLHPTLVALEEQLFAEGGKLAAALPAELSNDLVNSTVRSNGLLAAVHPHTLATLEEQLFSEGGYLSTVLPAELSNDLLGATIRSDGVLAAAMRLKFFGELGLLSSGTGAASQADQSRPVSKDMRNTGERIDAGVRVHQDGLSRVPSGLSLLMDEAADMMHNLPAELARQVLVSILEGDGAVAAQLRERLVLLLLSAREVPSRPSSATRTRTSPGVDEHARPITEPTATRSIKPTKAQESGYDGRNSTGTVSSSEFPAHAADKNSSQIVAPYMQKQCSAKSQAGSIAQTPRSQEGDIWEEDDKILEFNISRPASRSSTPEEDRFNDFLDASNSFLKALPDTPARSLLCAAFEGESHVSAAVRERLYQLSQQAPPSPSYCAPDTGDSIPQVSTSRENTVRFTPDTPSSHNNSETSAAGRIANDAVWEQMRSGASHRHKLGISGDVSPIYTGSVLPTPRSDGGGPLDELSELALRSVELVRRLPDESAIALTEALLVHDSPVAAGVRSRLRKIPKPPKRQEGNIFSVKHNLCTQDGLKQTLGVIREGSPDVEVRPVKSKFLFLIDYRLL